SPAASRNKNFRTFALTVSAKPIRAAPTAKCCSPSGASLWLRIEELLDDRITRFANRNHLPEPGIDSLAGNHEGFICDLKGEYLGFKIAVPGYGKSATRGGPAFRVNNDASFLLHCLLDTPPFFLSYSIKDNGFTCAHS